MEIEGGDEVEGAGERGAGGGAGEFVGEAALVTGGEVGDGGGRGHGSGACKEVGDDEGIEATGEGDAFG